MRLSLGIGVLVSTALCGQDIVFSPAGSDLIEGNRGNGAPFAIPLICYQQIHDQQDMVDILGGAPLMMSGLAFRKDTGGSNNGRDLDVTIRVNSTAVASASATLTFADNLGANPTLVLPTTRLRFPSMHDVSVPNPPDFVVPWSTPYFYLPTAGTHFCWEWRHRNGINNPFAYMDAVSSGRSTGSINEGAGCIASGQAEPAAISTRSLAMTSFTYNNVLSFAAIGAPAVFMLGLQRLNVTLPGACAAIVPNPLVLVQGGTDATGAWDLTLPTGDLRGLPRTEFLGQFAFLDSTLPLGLGFSDTSVLQTPLAGAHHITRIYIADPDASVGEILTLGYGLVTGFKVP